MGEGAQRGKGRKESSCRPGRRSVCSGVFRLLPACVLLPVPLGFLLLRLALKNPPLLIELLALFAALLLHEGGHLLALLFFRRQKMKSWGKRRSVQGGSVLFRPWGIELRKGEGYRSYGEEIAVSLAGAAANFLTAGLLFLWNLGGSGSFGGGALFLFSEKLIQSSLLFAVLNLLPIEGLDGGSALEALLLLLTPLRIFSVQRLLRILSLLLLIPLWLLSLCILIASSGNLSFFALCVSLFLELYRKQPP